MAPFSWSKFRDDQRAELPEIRDDLTGKTVILVGANIGMGFEGGHYPIPPVHPVHSRGLRLAAALKLASMNPGRLIITCRDENKGKKAVDLISESTGCTNVEYWLLEMLEYSSISALVERFDREGGGRLDILILSVGVSTRQFEFSKEGWESTLQVNHLGPALLCLLLVPYLSHAYKTNNSPRIVVVSSDMHFFLPRLEEADSEHILKAMNDPKIADMNNRYYVSKLLNVFFTRAFASRLISSSPITVNSVNPGFCKTQFVREVSPLELIGVKGIDSSIARTPEMGSRALIHAALAGTKQEVHGKYLNSCRVEEESDFVISLEGKRVQDRLWNETLDILKFAHPLVQPILNRYFLQTL